MLHRLTAMQSRVIGDDEGATLVEYALLLVFIAVVAIAALTTLGDNISDELDSVASSIANP